MRYTCRTKDWTPEPSVEQGAIVKKLCEGKETAPTITPGRELFGDDECPGMYIYTLLLSLFHRWLGNKISFILVL